MVDCQLLIILKVKSQKEKKGLFWACCWVESYMQNLDRLALQTKIISEFSIDGSLSEDRLPKDILDKLKQKKPKKSCFLIFPESKTKWSKIIEIDRGTGVNPI